MPINQMINQLPSFQQALQALRVRKKQPAPMRVLAAACRFLGRLLFLFMFMFSSRLEQGRDSGSLGPWQQPRLRASRLCGAPHCTDQGSVQRGLSPARAQPSTGSHQRGLNMQQKHHLRQQHPLQVHRWAFLLAFLSGSAVCGCSCCSGAGSVVCSCMSWSRARQRKINSN